MITQEELKEFVSYDPETGIFRWIKKTGRKGYIGKEVGSKHSRGYKDAKINGKHIFLHRAAWLYMTGSFPVDQIDHKNGDRSDNRWENLREACQQQNSANMKMRKNNKSGLKGVSLYPKGNRWRAFIHIDYKTKYLGSFLSKEEAHAAYIEAAQLKHGEFARIV